MATHEFTEYTYPLDPSLTFKQASEIWFARHARDLKANTVRSYNCALVALVPFFGEIVLKEMHVGHLRGYQDQRRAKAGEQRINSEIGTLGMILKEAGQRDRVWHLYKPLRVTKRRSGHSLTPEEEQRLRLVAFSKTKWILAGHCMTVMLSTTMGFGELRTLRRRDVVLKRKCVTIVEGAKNIYRERTIPLNTFAFESMCWIIDRWTRLGESNDEQYILPHRPRSMNGPWLFDEPQTAIRSAFEGIRVEAGLPHFRIYDCRVQAITKLLSNPAVSTQVSKEIAGHISQAMQDRYSIQRFDSKKAALEAMDAMDGVPPAPPEPTTGAAHAPAVAHAAPIPVHPAIQAEIMRQAAKVAKATEGMRMREPVDKPAPKKSILMDPAVQAEIARQVALAVQGAQMWEPIPGHEREKDGPRLVRFPGGR